MATPKDLASELGIPELRLRRWLRKQYRPNRIGYGQRWQLTLGQVVAACRHFFG